VPSVSLTFHYAQYLTMVYNLCCWEITIK